MDLKSERYTLPIDGNKNAMEQQTSVPLSKSSSDYTLSEKGADSARSPESYQDNQKCRRVNLKSSDIIPI